MENSSVINDILRRLEACERRLNELEGTQSEEVGGSKAPVLTEISEDTPPYLKIEELTQEPKEAVDQAVARSIEEPTVDRVKARVQPPAPAVEQHHISHSTAEKKDWWSEINWEFFLGTRFLLWLGGLFLLIGAGYFASLIQPKLTPQWRVILSSLASFCFIGFGAYLTRFYRWTGRNIIIIGISLLYLTSFASHYIQPMKVFGSILPAVLCMFASSGCVLYLAQRWKSEMSALYAVFLGFIVSLILISQNGQSALISLLIISVINAILLWSNQWIRLTTFAMLANYAAMGCFLLFESQSTIIASYTTFAIVFSVIHLVYAGAYALMEEDEEWKGDEDNGEKPGVAPELPRWMFVYSNSYSILNSLLFISLSLGLCFLAKEWKSIEWMLFWIGGLESARFLIPVYAKRNLTLAHGVIGFSLITLGFLAYLEGLAESLFFSIQVLIIAVISGMNPRIRSFRILAIFPAMFSSFYFLPVLTGAKSPTVTSLLTPLLLLLATLDWKYVWRTEAEGEGERQSILSVLELFGEQAKALIGFGILATLIVKLSKVSDPSSGNIYLGLAAIMITLFTLLSARSWICSLVPFVVAMILLGPVGGGPAMGPTLLYAVLFIILVSSLEFGRKFFFNAPYRIYISGFGVLLSSLVTLILVFFLHQSLDFISPVIFILLMGLLVAGKGFQQWKSSAIFLGDRLCNRVKEEKPFGHSLWIISGCMLAVLSYPVIAFVDSTDRLLPSGIYALIMGGILIYRAMYSQQKDLLGVLSVLMGPLLLTLSLMSFLRVSHLSFVYALVAVTGWFLLSNRLKVYSSMAFCGLLFGVVSIFLGFRSLEESESLWTTVVSILVVASGAITLTYRNYATREGSVAENLFIKGINYSSLPRRGIIAASLFSLMVLLTHLSSYTTWMVTVSWAFLALSLLIYGFILKDQVIRYFGMGVFLLASIRLLLIDLEGQDTMAKVGAFCGLGVVMVISAVCYAKVQKALEKAAHKETDDAPSISSGDAAE